MRSPALRTQAWEYLRDALHADVALVQEASPPPKLRSIYRPIDPKNKSLNWGSAVVALRPDISLHPRRRVPLADCYFKTPKKGELPDSHPGASAVGDVLVGNGKLAFTAVSLYGQWEEMPGGGALYACARLHRMMSDLTDVFASSRRKPIVVAGDLNITTQVAYEGQTQTDTDGAAAVFARLRAWGLTDCLSRAFTGNSLMADCTCGGGDACTHVQTFRLKNQAASRPTQLDYAFASQPLVPRLIRSQVVHDNEAWRLSDHCPLVLEFDEPRLK